jgi:hypothetical protein
MKRTQGFCPFCPGREEKTPPGFYINPTPPEDAARFLREAADPPERDTA